MITIVERLKQYIDFKGIAVSSAERDIGVSNATLSKPFKSKTTIKTDTLEKFLIHYNDINPIWLLTGEGDMIKECNAPRLVEQTDVYMDLAIARLEIINSLKLRVQDLEKEMEDRKKQNPKLTLYDAVAEPKPELSGKNH